MDIRVATKLIQDKVHQIVRQRKAAEAVSEAAVTNASLPAAVTSQASHQSQSAVSQQSMHSSAVSQAQSQQIVSNHQSTPSFTTSSSTPTLQSLVSDVARSTDSGIGVRSDTTNSAHTTYVSDSDGPITFTSQQVLAGSQLSGQATADSVSTNPVGQPNTAGSMQPIAASSRVPSQPSLPALAEPASLAATSKPAVTNNDQSRREMTASNEVTSEASSRGSTASANTHQHSEVCPTHTTICYTYTCYIIVLLLCVIKNECSFLMLYGMAEATCW